MKSVKSGVVTEAEIHFFENIQGSDLFLKLLNHKQFALALTDDLGNVILSNTLFIKKVMQGSVRPDFHSFIYNSKDGQSVQFNTGSQIIELIFLKLAEKPNGAGYLWFVSNNVETTLFEKSAKLKSLYQSFVDTSFELMFRTSLQDKVLFTNSLLLKSLGFENFRAIKESSAELFFEDTNRYLELKQQLLTSKKFERQTVFFKMTNGKRLTGLVNGSLHTDELGNSICTWTVLDVSQQIEFESELQQRNDELAKVNLQMEKFLYSTSHDLRSPITSILGLVNLVRMESKETVVLDYVSKIESSTQKLDKIIRDIMTFSRATYKRVDTEKVNFDIIAWKAFNNFRSDPNSKKIHFEVKSTGDVPFYADSERLDIIFENIIRNAIQFYDTNKSRPFIQVNTTITKTNAVVEIIDNGLGIGKQHMEHVFSMFYKATHYSRGAGLGLYIVKETAEKLGATISLESEIGFGTVLRLSIPNDLKGKLIDRKTQLKHQI